MPIDKISLLILLITSSKVIDSGSDDGRKEGPMKDTMVDLHNYFRREERASNMHKLKWDQTLAENADFWAKRCEFVHGHTKPPKSGDDNHDFDVGGGPDNDIIGQNMFISNSIDIDNASVVKYWFEEKKNYDFDGRICRTDVCSNYLQLVWADTKRLGCSSAICDHLKGIGWSKAIFVVCYYEPAGNYIDHDPYIRGEPCGSCISSCEEELTICWSFKCIPPILAQSCCNHFKCFNFFIMSSVEIS